MRATVTPTPAHQAPHFIDFRRINAVEGAFHRAGVQRIEEWLGNGCERRLFFVKLFMIVVGLIFIACTVSADASPIETHLDNVLFASLLQHRDGDVVTARIHPNLASKFYATPRILLALPTPQWL